MNTQPLSWSDMLSFYQSAKEFFTSASYAEKASEFLALLERFTNSDEAILLLNSEEEITALQRTGSRAHELSELIDALPLLYQSYSFTKFEPDELEDIQRVLSLAETSDFTDGAFFAFEINPELSLWFILFRTKEAGGYTESDTRSNEQLVNYLEELVNFTVFVEKGKELSDQLRSQTKRQSIWLESLAWLNDLGNNEYSDSELNDLYKTALFQLKMLVRADSAVAYSVGDGDGQVLMQLASEDSNGLAEYFQKMCTRKTEGFEIGKHFILNRDDSPSLAEINVQSIISYPLFVDKSLKMVLCFCRVNSTFNEHEEMISTLFAEGLEHIVERMFFLRAMREQNAFLNKEKLEQQKLIGKLQEAQEQLLQQEKMASIGSLAAGVAHEINNPVGYVNSNINSMEGYIKDIYKVLDIYEKIEAKLPKDHRLTLEVKAMKEDIDYDFIRNDISDLISESVEGVLRVKQIVKDLKDFSHVDEAEWQTTNIEKGVDSTLNIVHNELKYKADIVKDYEGIPEIQCVASQVNQVIMNLLVNAGHAIEEQGTVTIRTRKKDENFVYLEVSDTGKGIAPENLTKIFAPFFTTKPVGEGTGLGLSLSYSIAEKHGGELSVTSEVGVGTTFRLMLPIKQKDHPENFVI